MIKTVKLIIRDQDLPPKTIEIPEYQLSYYTRALKLANIPYSIFNPELERLLKDLGAI